MLSCSSCRHGYYNSLPNLVSEDDSLSSRMADALLLRFFLNFCAFCRWRKRIGRLTFNTNNFVLHNILHNSTCEYTHTHPFNGPLSRTTQVSQYQKGKTNLDFTEARDSEWQWHQLGSMQVCTLLQTDNHASTPPLGFYRPDALPATQPTASKHWLCEYIQEKVILK